MNQSFEENDNNIELINKFIYKERLCLYCKIDRIPFKTFIKSTNSIHNTDQWSKELVIELNKKLID